MVKEMFLKAAHRVLIKVIPEDLEQKIKDNF
jgi:hypothetical protein